MAALTGYDEGAGESGTLLAGESRLFLLNDDWRDDRPDEQHVLLPALGEPIVAEEASASLPPTGPVDGAVCPGKRCGELLGALLGASVA